MHCCDDSKFNQVANQGIDGSIDQTIWGKLANDVEMIIRPRELKS
jgi:hypothetical protein